MKSIRNTAQRRKHPLFREDLHVCNEEDAYIIRYLCNFGDFTQREMVRCDCGSHFGCRSPKIQRARERPGLLVTGPRWKEFEIGGLSG